MNSGKFPRSYWDILCPPKVIINDLLEGESLIEKAFPAKEHNLFIKPAKHPHEERYKTAPPKILKKK